ncbi:Vignain [Phytophthora citrophthora]|uniref:Vignain n=1 Tax=Phytophthora citrophthora TaxID=4793 RepID=A0AAD9LTL0_9STRA|nr:Vignain [Phytophthora citrophthora]
MSSDAMVTQFLLDERMDTGPSEFRRKMEDHVDYLEQVHKLAAGRDWVFPYAMGVSSRHLYQEGSRTLSPLDFVLQEHQAAQRQQHRRLTEPRRLANSTLGYRTSLDWCSTNNVHNQSICTDIKNQKQCGSCWSFAAADAIESAVVINAGTAPHSLSPQQFLECSSREMAATFEYCWAEGGVNGASWLQTKMIWGSKNNACNGGMTHAAFADAAQFHWSLLGELDLPYNEEDTSQASAATLANACDNSSTDNAAASISGWEQVVGLSCDVSSDPTELLKLALQQQPVSAAINSGGSFDSYKSGIYSCPNDGDFASSSDINHAIVLVGYGSDGTTDYWILKNSYGASWGEKGFMRLAMDSKINCGLSVFPIIPTGAIAGAAHTSVDGGGAVEFVGMSPDSWVVLGIAVAVVTLFITVVGIVYASRQRNAFKETL